MKYRSNRELFDAVAQVTSRDVAYRGYLIKHNLVGGTWIEKDGHLIGWAKNDDEARATIDMLVQ